MISNRLTASSAAPRPQSQAASSPSCPLPWTCPVCRSSLAAGEEHPHLAKVLGPRVDRNNLAALAQHPAVDGLDAVRLGDGTARWLVWSRGGSAAFEAASRVWTHRAPVAEAMTLQLREDLGALGFDPVGDPPCRWWTIGWVNGWHLGQASGLMPRLWAESYLGCYPEAAAAQAKFQQLLEASLPGSTCILEALRSVFGELEDMSDRPRGLGVAIALGIRCARTPHANARGIAAALARITKPQRFVGQRLEWLATTPLFAHETLLGQVLAFMVPRDTWRAVQQAVAVRQILREYPKCGESLLVLDWARAGFMHGYRLVGDHPGRAERLLNEVAEPHLQDLFVKLGNRLGFERECWTEQRVVRMAEDWLEEYHQDYDAVPVTGLRALFRAATAFDVTFWMGMAARWVQTGHRKALVPSRN